MRHHRPSRDHVRSTSKSCGKCTRRDAFRNSSHTYSTYLHTFSLTHTHTHLHSRSCVWLRSWSRSSTAAWAMGNTHVAHVMTRRDWWRPLCINVKISAKIAIKVAPRIRLGKVNKAQHTKVVNECRARPTWRRRRRRRSPIKFRRKCATRGLLLLLPLHSSHWYSHLLWLPFLLPREFRLSIENWDTYWHN